MKKQCSLLAVFTFISLTIKSFIVRYEILGEIDISGITTEISFLLLFLLVLSQFRERISNSLNIIVNFTGSFFLLTAIMYFDYYNAIITYKSLAQAGQVGEIRNSISALFKVHYLLFFIDFLLLLFWIMVRERLSYSQVNLKKKPTLILIIFSLFFISRGFYQSFQSISELNQYNNLGFFGYQFMEVSTETGLLFKSEPKITIEMIEHYKPSQLKDNIQLKGIAENKNLIIVQLESVQNFLLNKSIEGKEITPNLNSFLNESYYFPNFYTQVGKGNTSDAEFLVNTSIYALGNEPMSTAAAGKNVPSLPKVLKSNGYYSATFHANEISFWSRKEMYQAIGFDQYFDQDYFGKEDFIAFGVSDEILYKKTIEKLRGLNKGNFYAHIIALSSHFPYDLPVSKEEYSIDLTARYDNSIVGSYIKSVSYADYAFGKFIQEMKSSGLYDDTVIVVYGDHQGLQTQNDNDVTLVNETVERDYHSILDHLNVPLIVKVPSISEGTVINTIGGLVDIYPTVANLLGIDISKEPIFGTDLINSKTNTIGIRFYAPTGTFITNEYAFSPGKKIDSGQLTSLSHREERPAAKDSLTELKHILNYMNLSDDYFRSLK